MFKLIMGLGNPGITYKNTYHNIGQIFVDSLADSAWKRAPRKHFVYSQRDEIILVKATTFMNESGLAANEALSYFKTIPYSFLVAHDDSDFFWGTHKLAYGKGPAGHKGVESIIKELGTKNFWRLRIGIREQGSKEALSEMLAKKRPEKAGDFVLKKITKEHQNKLAQIFLNLRNELEQIP